jgi:DnaK suppressor protein
MPPIEDREHLRQLLIERIAQTRASLDRRAVDTSAVTPDAAIGRLTRMEAMQAGQVAEAARRERQAELTRLEAALHRVDDEDFGVCRECGEAIPLPRLLARPGARLCVACAEAAEAR